MVGAAPFGLMPLGSDVSSPSGPLGTMPRL